MLLYVNALLYAVTCESLTGLNVEDSVWCMATLQDNVKILIGVVYRSPSSSSEKVITALSNIDDYHNCSDLLVMGDFNAPNVDWSDYTCLESANSFSYKLINATLDSYLTQHVLKPTRHILGQRPSILDLVFTSDPNLIENLHHHSPLGSSDHECLLFELNYVTKQCRPENNICKYNYMKADYEAINSELDKVHWDTLLCEESTTGNHSRVLLLPSLVSILLKLPRNVSITNLAGGLPKLVKLSRKSSTCFYNTGLHALRQIMLVML